MDREAIDQDVARALRRLQGRAKGWLQEFS
jgi:hypothetical protein